MSETKTDQIIGLSPVDQAYAEDMRRIRRAEGVRRFSPDRIPISPDELVVALEKNLRRGAVKLDKWDAKDIQRPLGVARENIEAEYRSALKQIRARKRRDEITGAEKDALENETFLQYMVPETIVPDLLDEGVSLVADNSWNKGGVIPNSWMALTNVNKGNKQFCVMVGGRGTDFPVVTYEVFAQEELPKLMDETRSIYGSGPNRAFSILSRAESRFPNRQVEVGYYPEEYDIAKRIVKALSSSTDKTG